VPLLTAIAVLAMTANPACGPLDLETALQLTAARNDEVAIRRAEVEAALADVAVARALRIVPEAHVVALVGPTPAARGNVVASPDSNRQPLRDLGPFGRVEGTVIQPLFTWGRLQAATDASEAGAKAQALLMQDDLARVQERIVRLYWADALARRLLAITADIEQALSEADRRVARSLERADGETTQTDRYRLTLFRGIVQQRALEARRGRDLARIGLAAALSLPVGRLSLRESPLEGPGESIPGAEEAQRGAEASRLDLQSIAQAIAAKEAQIRMEEAAALPQVFVGGVLAYSYAPNRDIQLNPWVRDYFNEFVLGFFVGVRQDLAFPSLIARASRARAEKEAMERRRDALRNLVAAEVDGTLAELRAAVDRLEAAHGTATAGKSWFQAATLDFSAGLVEARDLVEAYEGYVASQGALAHAAYDVRVARGRLAFATGVLPMLGAARCDVPSS